MIYKLFIYYNKQYHHILIISYTLEQGSDEIFTFTFVVESSGLIVVYQFEMLFEHFKFPCRQPQNENWIAFKGQSLSAKN